MADSNKTALFVRYQSGGIYLIDDIKNHPGDVFFVDSTNTAAVDNTGAGKNPDLPFATIDYAVSQCTGGACDVIYVLPNHTENLAAAGALVLDVLGIKIQGLGKGASQPVVSHDAAASDVDIDGNGVWVDNINFVANFADVAVMIDVNADDFTISNCRFTQAAVDLNGVICIQDAAGVGSDRIHVSNCHAIMYDAVNTHFINYGGTGDGHIVRDCTLLGDWGTMCIGGAGVVTNAVVLNNAISNAANDNDSCINFAATATGICAKNLACGAAAQANGIATGDLAAGENYYGVVGEDLSAILEPPNA